MCIKGAGGQDLNGHRVAFISNGVDDVLQTEDKECMAKEITVEQELPFSPAQ